MASLKQKAAGRIQPYLRNAAGPASLGATSTALGGAPVCGGPTKRLPRGPRRRLARQRRGVVALWLILALPVLLLLSIVVIEIGNIWLARAELENALEAAALAAVKEWGDSSGAANLAARNVGVTYAAANTVTGSSVVITTNHGALVNENASLSGNLVFGAVTTTGIPWVFSSSTVPGPGTSFGVRAQATVVVNSVACRLGGYVVPAFQVSATATARYAVGGGSPQLIRVRPENFS